MVYLNVLGIVDSLDILVKNCYEKVGLEFLKVALTIDFDAEKKTVVFTESDIYGHSCFVIKRTNDSISTLREPTFQTSYSKNLWKAFDFTKDEVFTLDSVYEQSELEPGVYFFAEYKRSGEDLKMLRLEMRKEGQENEEDL